MLLFAALALFIPVSVPVIFEALNMVHRPAVACAAPPVGSVFCNEFYADDGHIRQVIMASDLPNCCIYRRRVLDHEAGTGRVRICDEKDTRPIRCQAVERTGVPTVIDGRVMTVNADWAGHRAVLDF